MVQKNKFSIKIVISTNHFHSINFDRKWLLSDCFVCMCTLFAISRATHLLDTDRYTMPCEHSKYNFDCIFFYLIQRFIGISHIPLHLLGFNLYNFVWIRLFTSCSQHLNCVFCYIVLSLCMCMVRNQFSKFDFWIILGDLCQLCTHPHIIQQSRAYSFWHPFKSVGKSTDWIIGWTP